MALNLYPTMEFWLCIDRCFSVAFALRYSQKNKQFLCFIIFISVGGIIAIGVWANNLLTAMEKSEPTNCRYFTCLMKSRSEQYIIKISITCMNFICGCILALLIKFMVNTNNSVNAKGKNLNKTVLIIIFSTTFFDLVPNFAGQIFESITTKPMSTYIGPYVTTLSAFNTALCTYIYSRAFKTAFKNTQSSFHTPIQAYNNNPLKNNTPF
uniref:Uncharacterized protein n=1 Tax=Panagrolaimus davidi TaxID=227884 RepID=A0A914QK61_9BILA